jgi:anti-sigma regulatory factor (Ser/Thr protein kinase)
VHRRQELDAVRERCRVRRVDGRAIVGDARMAKRNAASEAVWTRCFETMRRGCLRPASVVPCRGKRQHSEGNRIAPGHGGGIDDEASGLELARSRRAEVFGFQPRKQGMRKLKGWSSRRRLFRRSACQISQVGCLINELRVQATFPPVPESAAAARQLASRALDDWGLAAVQETTLLLVTELVSNVVRHANTPLTLDLSLDGPCLRVEVTDYDEHLPAMAAAGARSHHGWGLRFVRELSSEWGTTVNENGKTVWFDLNLDDPSRS